MMEYMSKWTKFREEQAFNRTEYTIYELKDLLAGL